MDDFLKSLLSDSKLEPTPQVLNSFSSQFPNALSVEWFNDGSIFEAVFFDENIEKIACFNKNGGWIDTRLNIPTENLPGYILTEVIKEGEIMSSIMINESDKNTYEFVVRNKKMDRQLIFTNDLGHIIRTKKFKDF